MLKSCGWGGVGWPKILVSAPVPLELILTGLGLGLGGLGFGTGLDNTLLFCGFRCDRTLQEFNLSASPIWTNWVFELIGTWLGRT